MYIYMFYAPHGQRDALALRVPTQPEHLPGVTVHQPQWETPARLFAGGGLVEEKELGISAACACVCILSTQCIYTHMYTYIHTYIHNR